MTTRDLLKIEIDTLSDEVLAEVYDFVKFLELKKDRSFLVAASQALSESSFKKIWDNEEDADYDAL